MAAQACRKPPNIQSFHRAFGPRLSDNPTRRSMRGSSRSHRSNRLGAGKRSRRPERFATRPKMLLRLPQGGLHIDPACFPSTDGDGARQLITEDVPHTAARDVAARSARKRCLRDAMLCVPIRSNRPRAQCYAGTDCICPHPKFAVSRTVVREFETTHPAVCINLIRDRYGLRSSLIFTSDQMR